MPYSDDNAGYQNVDTSKGAADKLSSSGRLARLRQQVRAVYRDAPDGLTADECAHRMGEDILSIRPRVTELKNDGYLVDTKKRRFNRSGRLAAVLRA